MTRSYRWCDPDGLDEWAEVVQIPFVRYTAHDDGRIRVTTKEPAGPRRRSFV